MKKSKTEWVLHYGHLMAKVSKLYWINRITSEQFGRYRDMLRTALFNYKF